MTYYSREILDTVYMQKRTKLRAMRKVWNKKFLKLCYQYYITRRDERDKVWPELEKVMFNLELLRDSLYILEISYHNSINFLQ